MPTILFDAFTSSEDDGILQRRAVMRQEIHEMVEAVRGLGIRLTGDPAPKCVRLTDPTNFAEKLERLQRALESVDASGAMSEGDGPAAPAPSDDPIRLKDALDKLIRLFQVKGGNLDEADAIVRDSLGLEASEDEAKRKKEHGTLPAFAPARMKRKKGFRPRLNLYPDRPGEASLNDLRKIVFDLGGTRAILGDTVPKNELAFARMQRRMPPPPPRGMQP